MNIILNALRDGWKMRTFVLNVDSLVHIFWKKVSTLCKFHFHTARFPFFFSFLKIKLPFNMKPSPNDTSFESSYIGCLESAKKLGVASS